MIKTIAHLDYVARWSLWIHHPLIGLALTVVLVAFVTFSIIREH